MPRLGSFVILPLLAAGLVIALISSMTATATHIAKTRAAVAPAAVAPARPAALDASSGIATVTATDFAFSTARIEAPAGRLELTLRNAGKVEHELVMLKTSAGPATLKISAAGRVRESASVGEVSEIKTGVSRSTAFDLEPGRYVYVCNIPGHYASGMRGVLIVK